VRAMPLSKIVAKSITDDTITTDQIADTSVHGVRNLVINGAMQVAQRGTSATSVSTEGYKCVDRIRWTMDSTSAVFTLSQSTDVPTGEGFSNSFKAEVTTADTSLAAGNQTRFEYRFEGQDVQQLAKGTSNAKKVTLSFWVKAFQTGTYVINMQDTDNSRLIAATYTVDASGTWEYKTVTLDGDTSGALTNDANLSLVLHWYLGAGSTYTSGTLATAWESLTNANRAAGQTVDIATSTSNYWAITGVQLEVGEQSTPFEHRSFADELRRCQRYYVEFRNSRFIGGYKRHDAQTSFKVHFPVSMRATPTVTLDDGGSFTNFQSVLSGTQSSPVVFEPGGEFSEIVLAVNSTYSGTHTFIPSWESQEVTFDAEL